VSQVCNVRAWLEANGFARFAHTFEENEIDGDALLELTEEHLKDFGIALGPRLKLLKAIESLRRASNEEAPAPVQTRKRSPLGQQMPEAERRQLTVMFVDLVGSTALSARLDPEDMREIMRAYQAACANVVCRFEGHVARFLGDGVLAFFGWPRAHEDDAERAVRAGLQLVQDVARLEPRAEVRLQARVGVATGHVVVGDLVSEGISDKDAVSGESPNLAARLQALAGPGCVVISQATRRLVGGLFELADLGPRRLQGFAEPLVAWRVEGEGRAEGRFEALHGEHLTPLVGREHELSILLERWAGAKGGDGQVVLLSGEPGIGKSRLIRTLRERMADEPYTPLSHYCSPYHTNSALYPVVGLLERAARLDRHELPDQQLARLEAVLARSSDRLEEVVPLLADLLGVPTDERYPALILTPEAQKRRTLQALVDQLAGLAAQQPVLALYEDVHWIDPSTLELLGLVIDRIQQLPVLALMTFRPEFQSPWTGQGHVVTLTMSRLGRRQGADLVARVTGDKPLPPAIVEQIVDRTDGVPLFVEELTKTVLESGLLADAGDHYELSGPLPPRAIPMTLHDSLMARLDRLAPVKELAQTAAAIGREFSHELLAAVTTMAGHQLDHALNRLISSELIVRRGATPNARYSFKHVLVQDVAYESLLKSKRQHLHARIAKALEERFPEMAATEPELLAQHYAGAGLTEQAIDYYQKAGERAGQRSANAEAIEHFTKGLELLNTLPDTGERPRRELDLQLKLGRASIAIKGYAAPEVDRIYQRAHVLCLHLGEPDLLHRALMGLEAYYLVRADLQTARQLVEQTMNEAKRANDPVRLMNSHSQLGIVLFHVGDVAAALHHLEKGIEINAPQHRQLPHRLQDPGVIGRCHEGLCLWHLGYPDQGRDRCYEALEFAKGTSHPFNIAAVSGHTAIFLRHCRQASAVGELAETVINIATEHSFAFWLAVGTLLKGWAVAIQGDGDKGIHLLREAIAAYRSTGAETFVPIWLGMLAEAYERTERAKDGLLTLDHAFAVLEKTGQRVWEAELQRLEGELILDRGRGKVAQAEACFERAVKIARYKQSRSWELRASTSLARLWRDQGRRSEAHDLLAPIYGWFTEGFNTADLKDAKALLEELA
jgi:class 3 adenylate cyclase/predicted ATPase